MASISSEEIDFFVAWASPYEAQLLWHVRDRPTRNGLRLLRYSNRVWEDGETTLCSRKYGPDHRQWHALYFVRATARSTVVLTVRQFWTFGITAVRAHRRRGPTGQVPVRVRYGETERCLLLLVHVRRRRFSQP